MLTIGLKKTFVYKVNYQNLASQVGSGDLDVLATPSLLAFMENSAKELVKEELSELDSTVGINVEMSHLAPTKLNDEVKVECELINVEGRILTFNILAYDSNTLVSKMVHIRCIVNKEKFMSVLSAFKKAEKENADKKTETK